MTALDLPAIRALHAAATPGPWFQGRESVRHESEKEVYSEREPSRTSEDICTAWHPHDAAFIAAAPSIVTQLLAKIDAVEAELAATEQRTIEGWGHGGHAVVSVASIRAALTGEGQ